MFHALLDPTRLKLAGRPPVPAAQDLLLHLPVQELCDNEDIAVGYDNFLKRSMRSSDESGAKDRWEFAPPGQTGIASMKCLPVILGSRGRGTTDVTIAMAGGPRMSFRWRLSPLLRLPLDEPDVQRTHQQKDHEDARAVRVRTDIRQDLTARL